MVRGFRLHRKVDDSGVSGTGIVAEGAQFHDGQCCLAWFSTVHAMAIYPSIEDLIKIHGHGDHTKVIWDEDCCACGSLDPGCQCENDE